MNDNKKHCLLIRDRQCFFSCALISKFVTDEKHFDSPGCTTSSCDDRLITDAVRGKAVCTDTRYGAWGIAVQPVAVRRGGNIMNPVDCFLDIAAYLIYTDKENDISWTIDQCGNSVACSINID